MVILESFDGSHWGQSSYERASKESTSGQECSRLGSAGERRANPLDQGEPGSQSRMHGAGMLAGPHRVKPSGAVWSTGTPRPIELGQPLFGGMAAITGLVMSGGVASLSATVLLCCGGLADQLETNRSAPPARAAFACCAHGSVAGVFEGGQPFLQGGDPNQPSFADLQAGEALLLDRFIDLGASNADQLGSVLDTHGEARVGHG